MGRKIPAKKHKGVKDPLKQQAQRINSLKTKINAPPKDPDDQPIPRSLTNLFAFKNKDKIKENKKGSNLFKTKDDTQINTKNPMSSLKKVAGESPRAFTLRINTVMKTLNNHQHGYPEDMEEDDHKGEQMAWQRERREKKRKRAAAANKGGDIPDETPKLSRGQKLTLKKKVKKTKAAEKSHKDVLYDKVVFGEVVHAPPNLVKPRRAQKEDGAARPGRRELLLNKLLIHSPNATTNSNKAKQKDLPIAEQMRRERARQAAVNAYRALKHRKPNKTQ